MGLSIQKYSKSHCQVHYEYHKNMKKAMAYMGRNEGKSGVSAIVHILLTFPYVQCATNQRITQAIKTLRTRGSERGEHKRDGDRESGEKGIDRDRKHANIECGVYYDGIRRFYYVCADQPKTNNT